MELLLNQGGSILRPLVSEQPMTGTGAQVVDQVGKSTTHDMPQYKLTIFSELILIRLGVTILTSISKCLSIIITESRGFYIKTIDFRRTYERYGCPSC
jgi:hypothetical protein